MWGFHQPPKMIKRWSPFVKLLKIIIDNQAELDYNENVFNSNFGSGNLFEFWEFGVTHCGPPSPKKLSLRNNQSKNTLRCKNQLKENIDFSNTTFYSINLQMVSFQFHRFISQWTTQQIIIYWNAQVPKCQLINNSHQIFPKYTF